MKKEEFNIISFDSKDLKQMLFEDASLYLRYNEPAWSYLLQLIDRKLDHCNLNELIQEAIEETVIEFPDPTINVPDDRDSIYFEMRTNEAKGYAREYSR